MKSNYPTAQPLMKLTADIANQSTRPYPAQQYTVKITTAQYIKVYNTVKVSAL